MVGFDMAEETKQFIKDPDYRGVSLMQKQDQMGYLGIGTLIPLSMEKNPSKNILIPGLLWLILIILWRKVFREKSKKNMKKEGAACFISDSLSGDYCVRIFSLEQDRTEF